MKFTLKEAKADVSVIVDIYNKIDKLKSTKALGEENKFVRAEIRELRDKLNNSVAFKVYRLVLEKGPAKVQTEILKEPPTKEDKAELLSRLREELKKHKQYKTKLIKNKKLSEKAALRAEQFKNQAKQTRQKENIFSGIRYLTTGGVFTKPKSIINMEINHLERIKEQKTPHPKVKLNYVGTELEFICKANKEDLQKLFAQQKLGSNVYVKTDGSIRGVTLGEYAHEVNVLCKEEDMKSVITKVCNIIKSVGGRVNDSCGMHMHFDMRNRDSIKAFNNMLRILPTLTAIIPNTRLDSEYCVMNKMESLSEFVEKYHNNNNYRRQAINGAAIREHNTIEVRLHSGTLNPAKIVNWFNIIKAAIEYKDIIEHDISVEKYAAFFEVNSALASYIFTRAQKFKGNKIDSVNDELDNNYEIAI